jgi:hypothetical protein
MASVTLAAASPSGYAPVAPGMGYVPLVAIGVEPQGGNAYPSPSVSSEAQKKKQKRNKPTLSCEECVERKTKVCARFRYG